MCKAPLEKMPDCFPGLGEKLGSGVDGSVYALSDGSVDKFSSAYDKQLLAEIATGKHPHFVEVFDFGVGESGMHFVVMERLYPITDDEAKVFHTIISHEDRGLSKTFTLARLDEVLDGLSVGLEFDKKAVVAFYRQVRSDAMTHLDLHERNLMKDKGRRFKLVDLNRISKEER